MVFSSNVFLFFFLPVFLLAYFLTPQRFRNYTLLLFSLVFYAFGAPTFIILLLLSSTLNYYLVQGMHKTEKPRKKKLLCGISIVFSLGLLLYFKYTGFFIQTIYNLTGLRIPEFNVFAYLGNILLSIIPSVRVLAGDFHFNVYAIVLPIGISFFTFQSITYTIDVYRGVTPPSKKLTDYVLYIMMFPQLIAGPIVKYNTVAAQIVSRTSTMEDRALGFYRFIIGLSKKVLIANTLALYADQVFDNSLVGLSSGAAWLGILAYTMQIYFDFSGYSDMAIGLGRMMGFTFPDNFNDPYTSRSITEFWRRWHITLGAFMKDYLYIPLGGNRRSNARTYFNLGIVFLCSGFWHGAAWTFVFWGVFHGLFIILDRVFLLNVLKKIGKIPSVIFTFFIVNLGWVLFRAETLAQAGSFYQTLFAFRGGNTYPIDSQLTVTLILALVFSFLTMTKVGQKLQDKVFAEHYSKGFSWLMFVVCIVLLVLSTGALCVSDFNPFIYFKF